MKNLFLVVLALCVYIPQANAQKVKDQEFQPCGGDLDIQVKKWKDM